MASISLGTALLVGGLASGAGSVASGLLGANASESAANTEATAAEKAAQELQQAGQTSNATASNVLGQQQNLLSPYAATGTSGLSALQSALQPGGSLTSQFAWDPASISQDPAYQAQLALGTQAVQRAAAASGTLNSGGTLRALDQYAQGVTAGYANQDYTQALNTFSTNRANTVQNLTLPVQIGEYGTSGLMSALQNYSQLFSQNTLQAAGGAANYQTQAASAQAAGTIGQANALSSIFGNVGSTASNGLTLSALLNALGGGTGTGLTAAQQTAGLAGQQANTQGLNGISGIGLNNGYAPLAPSAFPTASALPSAYSNYYGAPTASVG